MTTLQQEQWADLIEPVARALLGEPNPESTRKELRYGSRGSLSIDLEKGTWFDFETGKGGGVLALIERETGEEPRAWLRARGYRVDDAPARKRASSAPARKIDKVFDYPDADGTLLFQVVRYIPK